MNLADLLRDLKDSNPSDVHRHYCTSCRHIWEHDGAKIPIWRPGEVTRAHKCPVCGNPGWVKYYGNETHEEMCEMESLLQVAEDDRVPQPIRDRAEVDFERMAERLHRPKSQPRDPERPNRYADGAALKMALDILRGLE
jgi:hypothetical protein